MKETRLSIRYAKALLDLALEQNAADTVKVDMKLVSDVCLNSKDFKKLLSNPVINSFKKEAVLKEIFGKKISRLSLSFLLMIIAKKREVFIDDIADKYIELYKVHKGIKTAIIETTISLDNATKEKIINMLSHSTKSEIELVEKINDRLIGGFRLSFDNKQFDTSIASEIQKLRREFNVNIYEKGF